MKTPPPETRRSLARRVALAIVTLAFFCFGAELLDAEEPIDFDSQIVPALTKMGCNAGSCHGSAAGRGGFRLSLFGSRPAEDHIAIALAEQSRRVNRADPARSLLLRKPTGELEHGGDWLFDADDDLGQLIESWIRQGAKRRESPSLVRLVAKPQTFRLQSVGEEAGLQLLAHFADGEIRDVTDWAIVTPEDASAVEVDPQTNGLRVLRPGRHVLTVRYASQVISIEVILPVAQLPRDGATAGRPAENLIDRQLNTRIGELGLQAGATVSDAAWLRRLSLDLTGRLPHPSDVDDFVADPDPAKRRHQIRKWLESESFADFWAHRLARQLGNRTQARDREGARAFHRWLRQELRNKRPWDELASQLILASGDSHEIGPANFYRATPDARLQTELVTQSLLGIQLRCANCHDHPLDRWTQDDYHSLAAVFAKVRSGRVIETNPNGENIHPGTGEPATPAIPGEPAAAQREIDRSDFAAWVVASDNPWFARSIVNRVWSHLLGRGLVEPVDDLRPTNPGTHPALLSALAEDFVAHDYDLRHLIELICTSDAYARASAAGDRDPLAILYYAYASARPLPAAVLLDAIGDVTDIPEQWPADPEVERAIELYDIQTDSVALDILGRCPVGDSCTTGTAESGGGIPRQLHFLNGDLLNRRIGHPKSRLAKMLAAEKSAREIVDEFYRWALSREPTEAERTFWDQELEMATDPGAHRAVLEDFVWSLLSSREFQTNH